MKHIVDLTHNRFFLPLMFLFLALSGIILTYFFGDFSRSSWNVSIDKNQAKDIARGFLAEQQIDISDFHEVATFQIDGSDVFLQRALGKEYQARLDADPDLHMYGFVVRYFRELDPLEYYIFTDGIGNVIAQTTYLPENTPGITISGEEAKKMGENFLRDRMGEKFEYYELADTNETQLPERIDRLFTYRYREGIPSHYNPDDIAKKEARVEVKGDQILSYALRNIYLPENYERDSAKEASSGESYWLGAYALYIFMFIGALYFMYKKRHLPSSIHIKWAILLIFFLILILILGTLIDMEEYLLYDYSTDTPLTNFYLFQYVGIFYWMIFLFPMIVFLFIGQKIISSQRSFRHIGFGAFSFRAFLADYGRGICVGIFDFGLASLIFFLGAQYLGVWQAAMGNIHIGMMTMWSWILGAIFIGVYASFDEEIAFRLFGISFWKKITKSWVLAIVLSSIIWGFLHTTYPIYPMWFRGVEVMIGGIIWGLIYLRFGIWVTICAHYFFNMSMTNFSLFLLGDDHIKMYAVVAEVVGIVLPIVMAGIIVITRNYGTVHWKKQVGPSSLQWNNLGLEFKKSENRLFIIQKESKMLKDMSNNDINNFSKQALLLTQKITESLGDDTVVVTSEDNQSGYRYILILLRDISFKELQGIISSAS